MLDSVTLFDITMKDISLNGNFFFGGGDSVTEAAELRWCEKTFFYALPLKLHFSPPSMLELFARAAVCLRAARTCAIWLAGTEEKF